MKLFTTLLFITLFQVIYTQTLNCGTIGNSNARTPFTPGTPLRASFYLNTDNPATCSGTVTEWTICYYQDQSDSDGLRGAQFAVYRQNQTGTGYTRVSSQFSALKDTDSDSSSLFHCYTLQVNSNQLAEVLEGDVIGACIPRASENLVPLNIVGSGAPNTSLMEEGDCSFNRLPISVDPQVARAGLTLHVFANSIFTSPTTLPGGEPVTSPVSTDDNTEDLAETEAEVQINRESAQGGGNGTNTNSPPVAGGLNLGIVVAIVVVLVLSTVLVVVVVIFVILVVRHCKTDKMDNETRTNEAFASLSSRTYELPEITMSVKLEVQDELQKSSQDSKERIYDYANLRLERSEYVSMRTDPGPVDEPDYSLLEPLMVPQEVDYFNHLERNKQEDIYGSVGIYAKPASVETELYAQLRSFSIGSIPAKDITVTAHLGSGYFGQVQQGVWTSGDEIIDVAMKTLNKQMVTDIDKVKFLQEAAIMAQFRHPNIVSLYGITYKEEPMMLVLELVDRGNLKDYLLFLKPTPGEQQLDGLMKLLLKFSQQVALGMQYLSARGYIHRDLAARNVLVNKNGICKITDFGMSRDLAEENYYVANNRDAIPVKWTAPEALYYKKYSTASDVWSYGCLLYEIWSLGHTPFEEITNREVIRKISSGKRLSAPPGCPEVIYELMILSWNPSSSDRPKFREMVLVLIGKEEDVLYIPQEALDSHRLAGVLGAPLEAGSDMYPELERTYL